VRIDGISGVACGVFEMCVAGGDFEAKRGEGRNERWVASERGRIDQKEEARLAKREREFVVEYKERLKVLDR
jgi:hypothetical protein